MVNKDGYILARDGRKKYKWFDIWGKPSQAPANFALNTYGMRIKSSTNSTRRLTRSISIASQVIWQTWPGARSFLNATNERVFVLFGRCAACRLTLQRQSSKAFIGLTIRAKMITRGDPYYLKFGIKLTALERNRRFSIYFRPWRLSRNT